MEVNVLTPPARPMMRNPAAEGARKLEGERSVRLAPLHGVSVVVGGRHPGSWHGLPLHRPRVQVLQAKGKPPAAVVEALALGVDHSVGLNRSGEADGIPVILVEDRPRETVVVLFSDAVADGLDVFEPAAPRHGDQGVRPGSLHQAEIDARGCRWGRERSARP